MQNSQIAFAVTTYYPKWYRGKLQSIKHTDKIRGDLALEFCKKATKLSYVVVCSDAKATKTFRNELKKIKGLIVSQRLEPKRSPAKRHAYKIATKIPGVKVIIGTEPEKVALIDSANIIAKPLLENKADIVVMKRNDKLFKQSYPGYMYESEQEGNKLYNEFLELYKLMPKNSADLDMFFGPRAFRNEKKILNLFMKKHDVKVGNVTLPKEYFDPEQLSNTSFFPIVEALKKQLRI
ncbi:hypothetical protein HY024_00990, partial [Candidatus Curtissbacteria bacterium]|nr:hypothetical protein [Candidatus Curtissbacteria bacterium]